MIERRKFALLAVINCKVDRRKLQENMAKNCDSASDEKRRFGREAAAFIEFRIRSSFCSCLVSRQLNPPPRAS